MGNNMNKDDKELFGKTATINKPNLPYKFFYAGWRCTASNSKKITYKPVFVCKNPEKYGIVIDAGIDLETEGTTGLRQFYDKNETLEKCIAHFKSLIDDTNRNNKSKSGKQHEEN
jgi:hypothetical protein